MTQVNTPETAPAAAPPSSQTDPVSTIYCASAIGALCLGLGDLLKNGEGATVLKLGEVSRQLMPHNQYTPLLSLLILVILGGMICWVQQPLTRVDGFARGFSVFAVLTVAAPYQAPPPLDQATVTPAAVGSVTGARHDAPGLSTDFRFTGAAPGGAYRLAQVEARDAVADKLRRVWQEKPKGHGLAGIRIRGTGAAPPAEAMVKVRDAKSAKILGQNTTRDGTLLILRPKGSYVVEIEAAGYRRATFNLDLGEELTGFEIRLEKSSVPLNLQRLVAAQEVKPRRTKLLIP